MALMKHMLGGESKLLQQELHEGYIYFCHDTNNMWIDYKNEEDVLVRSRVSAEYADKLRYTKDGEIIEITPEELLLSSDRISFLENGSSEGSVQSVNSAAGGKGFEIVGQTAIYDNKTEEETITFNSPSTYDVTVKSGETQHIIKSVSTSSNIPISLVYHTTNAESVTGNMFYISSFPYRVDVTDSRYSGGYTIYDDNMTNQTINIEIERLSGQGLQLQNSFEASTTQDISAKYNNNTAIVIITQTGFDGAINVNNSPVSNSVEIDVSSLTINDTISITAYGTPIYKVEYYENVPTGFGVYTLASTEGLEVGMTYSVKLSTAKYNAGTITAINGNDITVDGYTYIEPYTEEEIASATSEYFRANYLTITGRPDLGDMEVGYNAIALGEDCVAQDRCGFATGYNNRVIGQYGFAEGRGHIVGYAGHAEGYGNEALGDTAHAEGKSTKAIGANAHSEGDYTTAFSSGSHSTGENTCAGSKGYKIVEPFTNDGSGHVSFKLNTVDGLREHIGSLCTLRVANEFSNEIKIYHVNEVNNEVTLSGVPAEAQYETEADNSNTHTIENYIIVHGRPELGDIDIGHNAYSGGYKSYAQGRESFATGRDNKAVGQYGAVFGRQNIVAYGAFASGRKNTALGDNSHAEGRDTEALGNYSHAEGHNTKAIGNVSHAEGIETKAIGDNSHAEGINTAAEAFASHAEGNRTKALGDASHAEGHSTKALGDNSHAEGRDNIVEGYAAHAEGHNTKALGDASHAEGRDNIVEGYAAHAEGHNTKALGDNSHAEGLATVTVVGAKGAHAEGHGTIATARGQHVEGNFNIEDIEKKYVHITGNGTSDTARSNAYTLDWDGNGTFAGDVKINNDKSLDKFIKSCKYELTATNFNSISIRNGYERIIKAGGNIFKLNAYSSSYTGSIQKFENNIMIDSLSKIGGNDNYYDLPSSDSHYLDIVALKDYPGLYVLLEEANDLSFYRLYVYNIYTGRWIYTNITEQAITHLVANSIGNIIGYTENGEIYNINYYNDTNELKVSVKDTIVDDTCLSLNVFLNYNSSKTVKYYYNASSYKERYDIGHSSGSGTIPSSISSNFSENTFKVFSFKENTLQTVFLSGNKIIIRDGNYGSDGDIEIVPFEYGNFNDITNSENRLYQANGLYYLLVNGKLFISRNLRTWDEISYKIDNSYNETLDSHIKDIIIYNKYIILQFNNTANTQQVYFKGYLFGHGEINSDEKINITSIAEYGESPYLRKATEKEDGLLPFYVGNIIDNSCIPGVKFDLMYKKDEIIPGVNPVFYRSNNAFYQISTFVTNKQENVYLTAVSNKLYYSKDLINWELVLQTSNSISICDKCHGVIVATESSRNDFYFSFDGINFYKTTSASNLFTSSNIGWSFGGGYTSSDFNYYNYSSGVSGIGYYSRGLHIYLIKKISSTESNKILSLYLNCDSRLTMSEQENLWVSLLQGDLTQIESINRTELDSMTSSSDFSVINDSFYGDFVIQNRISPGTMFIHFDGGSTTIGSINIRITSNIFSKVYPIYDNIIYGTGYGFLGVLDETPNILRSYSFTSGSTDYKSYLKIENSNTGRITNIVKIVDNNNYKIFLISTNLGIRYIVLDSSGNLQHIKKDRTNLTNSTTRAGSFMATYENPPTIFYTHDDTDDILISSSDHNILLSKYKKDIEDNLNEQLKSKIFNVEVDSINWVYDSARALHYQSINVSGILSTDNILSDVALPTDSENANLQLEAYQLVDKIEIEDGYITLYCFSDSEYPNALFNLKLIRV